uniref:Homeobox domain-containing protein n=1 Tax=Anolis carolinensis TaxID=28377 RepID=A0A803T303_ANOCA
MYPNPARPPGLGLPAQNYVPVGPQYPEFAGYHHPHHPHAHHVPGLGGDPHAGQPSGPAWSSPYTPPPPKEDWHPYGPPGGPSANAAGQLGYGPADFSSMQPTGLLPPPPSMGAPGGPQLSPGAQRRTPFEWMRRSGTAAGGKTRTKDKYRVVYTDHQRLELEKEFHYSRYITIRRKAELAATLGLTERQVKIWFQNRRAKERKVNKKKMQQQTQPASTTTPTPPAVGTPGPIGGICSSTTNLVSSSPMTIKEEFLP